MKTGERFTVSGKIPLTELKHGKTYEVYDIVSREEKKVYKLVVVDKKSMKSTRNQTKKFTYVFAEDFEIYVEAEGLNKITPLHRYNQIYATKKATANSDSTK